MKRYKNINLPQVVPGVLDTEGVEKMFEEDEMSPREYGNRLPMSKNISPTKNRLETNWDRYNNNGTFWKAMGRKLGSYEGWNIDEARSDFYKWAKKNHIPSSVNLSMEFDNRFGLKLRSHWHRPSYTVDDNKIINKSPLWGYALDRYHKKYYNNEGHKHIGYKVNKRLTNYPEVITVVYNHFGKYMNGMFISAEDFTKIDTILIENVSRILPTDVYELFIPVYTPDKWVKKSRSELKSMYIERRKNRVDARRKKRMNKKTFKNKCMEIYEEGIKISKYQRNERLY